MNKILVIIAGISCLVFVVELSLANHIAGGEIRMRPSNMQGGFEVTLIQFWDENNLVVGTQTSSGNRDDDISIYIYKKRNNQLMDSVLVSFRSSKSVVYQNRSCSVSGSMKTLAGMYTGSVTLSPQKYNESDGYYMVWERCCRNGDIINIKNPGETGMVFYLEFPPTTTTNSSPEFGFPNGQYICALSSFKMDMSATDNDKDELRYSLVTPMRGNASTNMSVGNASTKSSYPLVSWANNISLSNTIPGTVPLTIDQSTGVITVTAGQVGLYVFAVACEEFRNGKKIGLVRREYQLLVIDCGKDKGDPPIVSIKGISGTTGTICPGQSLFLETAGSNQYSLQWQLNGRNIIGATSEKLMVSDTGSYTVVKSLISKCVNDTTSAPLYIKLASVTAVTITAGKLRICSGEVTTITGSPGPPNYRYLWFLEGQEIARDVLQISAQRGGMYTVKITDSVSGCTASDSVVIGVDSVSVKLPEKVTVFQGSTVSVTAVPYPVQGAYSYKWSPLDAGFKGNPDDSTAILGPSQETKYSVTIRSLQGCENTASIRVIVYEKLHIPTAFSPDNNGINDTFGVFNDRGQIYDVRIFNRWGLLIFQARNFDKPWNGWYKNQIVPAGMYPYIIRTTSGDFHGEVMVVR